MDRPAPLVTWPTTPQTGRLTTDLNFKPDAVADFNDF